MNIIRLLLCATLLVGIPLPAMENEDALSDTGLALERKRIIRENSAQHVTQRPSRHKTCANAQRLLHEYYMEIDDQQESLKELINALGEKIFGEITALEERIKLVEHLLEEEHACHADEVARRLAALEERQDRYEKKQAELGSYFGQLAQAQFSALSVYMKLIAHNKGFSKKIAALEASMADLRKDIKDVLFARTVSVSGEQYQSPRDVRARRTQAGSRNRENQPVLVQHVPQKPAGGPPAKRSPRGPQSVGVLASPRSTPPSSRSLASMGTIVQPPAKKNGRPQGAAPWQH